MISITIPKYIRQITLSEKQNPMYFEWDGVTIKARNKRIWLRLIKDNFIPIQKETNKAKPNYLKDEYAIYAFKGKRIVGIVDKHTYAPAYYNLKLPNSIAKLRTRFFVCLAETKEPIIANPTKVGKPRQIIIKGQDIYSGKNEFERAIVMGGIKSSFESYIQECPKIDKYPVQIVVEFHNTIKNQFDRSEDTLGGRWDIDNHGYPYTKAILDLLTDTGKIADDDRLHVTSIKTEFCPLASENADERFIRIRIFEDNRKMITDNSLYRDFHNSLKTNNEQLF